MATRNVTYKCPFCDKRYNRADLVNHIEDVHPYEIPKDFTPLRFVFNYVNKKPLDYHGKCTECGGPTDWDENVGRYKRQCNKKACHDSYVKKFETNMQNKIGTTRISQTDEGQKKMLANRKISGTYTFQNGAKKTYTGSYEKKALEFMDKVMNIDPDDLLCPGPVLKYELVGPETKVKKLHMYITDFYYIPYNLIIEVKDGGNNPNKRNMPEYRAKQIAKEQYIVKHTDFNYIRLTDNNMRQLLAVFMDLKMQLVDDTNRRVIHINESKEEKICPKCGSKNVGIVIKGEPIYICKDCGAYVDDVPFNHESMACMSMAPMVGLKDSDAYITLEPNQNQVFSMGIGANNGTKRYGITRDCFNRLVEIPEDQKLLGKKYLLKKDKYEISKLIENHLGTGFMTLSDAYKYFTDKVLWSNDQIEFDMEPVFEDTFDADKFVNNILYEDLVNIEESVKELING